MRSYRRLRYSSRSATVLISHSHTRITRHPRAFNSVSLRVSRATLRSIFFFPELDIGFWQTKILATIMSVPETSVDKNDSLVLWQNNIRCARQFSDLNTEPQTTGEKMLPHNHLRFRIFPLDSRHIPSPLFRCHYISHSILFGTIGIGHLIGDLIQGL